MSKDSDTSAASATFDATGAATATEATRAAIAARDDRLAELLARVARADREAFEALYRATSATLFGLVLRINRERPQAEEVLQEIYIAVWRQAASFDRQRGQALAWLTALARHRAIDSVRRKAGQPVTISRFGAAGGGGGGGSDGGGGDADEIDLLERLPSDEPGPLDLLDDASRAHALERCMDGLSGEQRSSLALAYYQGLSHAEVAAHLSQPLGTVKSWVRRGLQSLRGCLDRATQRLGSVGRVA